MSSLKILVLSDLHLEFGNFLLTQGDADVVVLAGDIWTGTRGVVWARESLPRCPIIYVAGNHEHWCQRLPDHLDALCEAAYGSNVHVLENDSVVIGGVTFHGATLWTDFELFADELDAYHAMHECKNCMGDFHKTTVCHNGIYRKLAPVDTVRYHQASLQWLSESLSNSTTKTNVVVTHHAPSKRSLESHFAVKLTSAAYASHLENFIEHHEPSLWIHGHTHHPVDYQIGVTRIVSNPRGYRGYGEVIGFNPQQIINVS